MHAHIGNFLAVYIYFYIYCVYTFSTLNNNLVNKTISMEHLRVYHGCNGVSKQVSEQVPCIIYP